MNRQNAPLDNQNYFKPSFKPPIEDQLRQPSFISGTVTDLNHQHHSMENLHQMGKKRPLSRAKDSINRDSLVDNHFPSEAPNF